MTADRDLQQPVTIAVICPTLNRSAMHETLYRAFDGQTHPAKELWVLDDSDHPSPFLLRQASLDDRLHYVHKTENRRIPTGTKRNLLIQMSTGGVIAHFDDDDWYEPTYLSSMLDALLYDDLDFVKLSTWCEVRVHDRRARCHYDARDKGLAHLWGWGFSYMYRRYVASRVCFPDAVFGEDFKFFQRLQGQGLKAGLVHDGADWVEHRLHGTNISGRAR